MKSDLRSLVPSIPQKPGVYQFTDKNGNIIYVGKARNLRKRVASYFSGNQSGKTVLLISRATGINTIVVENESDALLLENNLIKQHQPKYNILLKDDKTYPWICIKNERFPRVFSTRSYLRDGSAYFGPYTSGLSVKVILELIRQIYKTRNCNLFLSEENITSGKFKVCLENHIGNCKAPCVGNQTEEEYNENIRQIRSILKGNISGVIEHLKSQMLEYASGLRFEEAQAIKEKLEILARFRTKSSVVSNTIKNVDVFGMTQDANRSYFNYMKVVDGAVIQSFTLNIESRIDEDKESLLAFAITEMRERVNSDSPEIIVPFLPDIRYESVKYIVPERGDKLKLLELAERNAVYFKLEHKKRREIRVKPDRTTGNLDKMKADLHLPQRPVHIECFDNSNIMGQHPVAACVVFRNGKPSRKEYRHFNIKTVTGPDDFSSMEEIVYRRYRRMLDENQQLPQLVIVDGGKGQLSSALKSITKLGLRDRLPVIGIAKRLEEIYFPEDPVPIYIDKNSISLKIILQLRNEAHRFGISFHRDKRSAGMTRNELEKIPGIGPKSIELLFREIGSVSKIREAGAEKLEALLGKRKSSILIQYFLEEKDVPRESTD